MRIKVYQIDHDRDTLGVKFAGLRETQAIQQKNGRPETIDASIYNEVYEGEVPCKSLEDIYILFNTTPPPFFRGHSLSVSDVVEILENEYNHQKGCFFCNSSYFATAKFATEQTQKPEDLMRVVAVEPGKPAYVAYVSDTLRAFQQSVQGRIEITLPFEDDAVVVSNADSVNIGMKRNRTISGDIYTGPLFIIGDSGDETFCSLTDAQTEQYLEQFSKPELFADEEMDSGIQMK